MHKLKNSHKYFNIKHRLNIQKITIILGLYPKNFTRAFTSLLDSSRSVSPTFDNALFFVKEWEHSSLKNRQLFVGNYAIFSHYLQQIHRGNMSWKGNKVLFHLWYLLASLLLFDLIAVNFIWYDYSSFVNNYLWTSHPIYSKQFIFDIYTMANLGWHIGILKRGGSIE